MPQSLKEVRNVGDPVSVKEAVTRAEFDEYTRGTALKQLMGSTDGRKLVWWLLSQCEVFSVCFTGNNTTFFNEGKRQVGLLLLAELQKHAMEEYLDMVRERKDD